MDIADSLKFLGLNEKDTAAYIAVLRLQKAGPAAIAREAGLERTTVYKILEQLSVLGVIGKSVAGKRIHYVAESPQFLHTLIEKKSKNLDKLIPFLAALQGKSQARPTVRFYEDKESVKRVLMESLNCEEKLRRDFASVERIVEFLGLAFINHQIEERVRRRVHVRSLRCTPKEPRAEKDWYLRGSNAEVLREVRYLKQEIEFEPVIFIYDNTVTIISSEKESYALVIDSQELARAMKVLFDVAWVSSEKT